MKDNHIVGMAAIAAAATWSMSALAAPAFDPLRCSAIQNVDVPYDVRVEGARITFSGTGRSIVVAPAYMEVDGHRFQDAALNAAYYQNVRGFLHGAGVFPKSAAEFGKTGFLPGESEAKQNFLGGITTMCHSILNLENDQKRMRGAFANFVPPVGITLNGAAL